MAVSLVSHCRQRRAVPAWPAEFVLEAWEYPFRVYSNIHTDEVIVLVQDSQPLTGDGFLVGTPTWTGRLIESDEAVTGNPISPQGYALRRRVRLPHDAWRLLIGQGDAVLDMHIPGPGDGPLSLDALRDALNRANAFFDRYYPDRRFLAYTCDSWLFSPQL